MKYAKYQITHKDGSKSFLICDGALISFICDTFDVSAFIDGFVIL